MIPTAAMMALPQSNQPGNQGLKLNTKARRLIIPATVWIRGPAKLADKLPEALNCGCAFGGCVTKQPGCHVLASVAVRGYGRLNLS